MKWLIFTLVLIINLTLISADLSYSSSNLPNLKAPTVTSTTITFNNNTGNVNNSIYWNGYSWHNMSIPFFDWKASFLFNYNQTTITNLTDYALLNGSNQPFTGNLNINKSNPEYRLTDGEYSRLIRDNNNILLLKNRINVIGSALGAISINGSNGQTLTIPIATQHNSSIGTVAFWFKTSTSGIKTMWSITGTGKFIDFRLSNDGVTSYYSNTEVDNVARFGSTNITNGLWYYLVFQSNGTAHKVFINGIEETMSGGFGTDAGGWTDDINNLTEMHIGLLSWFGLGQQSIGIFDEINLFNTTLNSTEITSFYNAGAGTQVPSSYTGLVANYHLDEGVGNTASDDTSYANAASGYTALNWTTGKITATPTTQETQIIKSIDGINSGERGINTFGDSQGRTILQGGDLSQNNTCTLNKTGFICNAPIFGTSFNTDLSNYYNKTEINSFNASWSSTFNYTYDAHINNLTKHNTTFWYNQTYSGSTYNATYANYSYNQTTITNLTDYALLNGSNQPFTGNLNINKSDPEFRLTDTGDSEYARLTRTDTSKEMLLFNRINNPAGIGNAVKFNGINTSIILANMRTYSRVTITAWFNNTGSTGGDVFSQTSVGATCGSDTIQSNTNAKGELCFSNGVYSGAVFTGVNTKDNQWHFMAVSWNGSNVVVYLDGVYKAKSGNFSSNYTITLNQTNSQKIGSYFSTALPFNGTIDEVVIWNRSLSSTEISDLYNGGVGVYGNPSIAPFNSGLVAGWHLDETSGLIASDFFDGINGTLTTSTSWVTGKIQTASSIVEAQIISSKNGINSGEQGIITFGHNLGRTLIQGTNITSLNNMSIPCITFKDGSSQCSAFNGTINTYNATYELWSFNQSTPFFDWKASFLFNYNQTTPFNNWLSTFVYNYNQSTPYDNFNYNMTAISNGNSSFNQTLTDNLYVIKTGDNMSGNYSVNGNYSFNFYNGAMFIDGTNNYVGIGTINPTNKFQVSNGGIADFFNGRLTIDDTNSKIDMFTGNIKFNSLRTDFYNGRLLINNTNGVINSGQQQISNYLEVNNPTIFNVNATTGITTIGNLITTMDNLNVEKDINDSMGINIQNLNNGTGAISRLGLDNADNDEFSLLITSSNFDFEGTPFPRLSAISVSTPNGFYIESLYGPISFNTFESADNIFTLGNGVIDIVGNINAVDYNITANVYHGNIDWVYTIIGMSGNTACDNLDNKVAGYSYTCQTVIDTGGGTVACGTTLVALNAQSACKAD